MSERGTKLRWRGEEREGRIGAEAGEKISGTIPTSNNPSDY